MCVCVCVISGPSANTKTRLLSFNSTQPEVIIYLTGHNTQTRHLYLMGVTNSPLCRRGTEDETSAHRHAYLGCFVLGPEDVRNFGRSVGFPLAGIRLLGTEGPI